MKCANCKADALYLHKITQKTNMAFCGRHLPRFLEPLRKAGNLTTTKGYDDAVKATIELLGGNSDAPELVEVLAPTEESTADKVEVEIPKPRKKSAPKLAEDEVNS